MGGLGGFSSHPRSFAKIGSSILAYLGCRTLCAHLAKGETPRAASLNDMFRMIPRSTETKGWENHTIALSRGLVSGRDFLHLLRFLGPAGFYKNPKLPAFHPGNSAAGRSDRFFRTYTMGNPLPDKRNPWNCARLSMLIVRISAGTRIFGVESGWGG